MTAPAAVCGANRVRVPAAEVGCGEPIHGADDVYRCTDCEVPFHRTCAITHFQRSAATPIQVDWKLSCVRSEQRADKLLALARRLRQALGGRDTDDTCDCARCSAIRAFERFIATDNDDRSGRPAVPRGAAP